MRITLSVISACATGPASSREAASALRVQRRCIVIIEPFGLLLWFRCSTSGAAVDNSVHKVKKLCAYPLLHRKKKTALWVYALRHTFCISCQPEKKKGHRIGALMIPSSSVIRSEEHTSELQSRPHLVCRLLLEKKKLQSHIYEKANTPLSDPRHRGNSAQLLRWHQAHGAS